MQTCSLLVFVVVNMSRKAIDTHLFLPAGFILLALGLLGLSRLPLRPACPFEGESRRGRVVVTEAAPAGATGERGVIKGDVVLDGEGTPLRTGEELDFLLERRKPGQTVSLGIDRDGEKLTVSCTLGHRYGTKFIALTLLLGLLFWGIGFFVHLKTPAEKAARVFSRGCVAAAVAILLVRPGQPSGAGAVGSFLTAVYFIFYSLAPAFTLHFTLIYPRTKEILRKRTYLSQVLYLPALVFILFMGTSYFQAVHQNSLEPFRTYSAVYTVFRAYLLLYLIVSIGCLIHSYLTSDTIESRKKVVWILWGLTVGTAPFLLLWTLPHAVGIPPLIPEEAGYLFLLIVPLAVAFSIVKHRALDIDIVINRSIVYALVTGLIVVVYLALSGLAGYLLQAMNPRTSNLIAILYTLMAAILFSPVKTRVQMFVDKTFYRTKYEYQVAMKRLSNSLASARYQDEVIDILLRSIGLLIPAEKMVLMVRRTDGGGFEIRAAGAPPGIGQSVLRSGDIEVFRDYVASLGVDEIQNSRIDWNGHESVARDTILDTIGIEVIIPAVLQNRLVGFVALGRKRSGARFAEADLEILTPMAEEGFMALERLRLQETMILERAQREKLEELNRLKSEFISHVSHEFRTPLTSIRWSVENMMDGIPEKPSPGVKEYLAGIFDSSLHLSRMIENLLDITRIEAGRIEIHPESVCLAEEIRKFVEMVKPLAEKKKIRLEVAVGEHIRVIADRDSLRTIVTNLLENAMKYSNDGRSVRVEVMVVDATEGRERSGPIQVAELSVIDQGIGIPQEKLESIFGRFERIQEHQGPKRKGLGLGLHIVRKLVELQGGHIRVESEVGTGSRFTVTLPLAMMDE